MRAVIATLATLAALTATPAFAHPGHLGEEAGHNHWYVLGALGAALAIAGVTVWHERRAKRVRKEQADKAGEREATEPRA